MDDEHRSARSRRIASLASKFRNKRYRDSYVSATNRRFLAQQIRALRGDMSQEEFGKLIGKPQSVVSRLEDPGYGKLTQQTVHEVAAALDRAVVTRIVDFPTFLRFTGDMSKSASVKPIVASDQFRRFAADTFGLRVNHNMAQVTFSLDTTDAAENEIVLKEATALLTLQSLKVLQIILAGTVEAIEQQFGVIALAPGKEDELRKTGQQLLQSRKAPSGDSSRGAKSRD